jgi:hypothetical protein
MKQSYKDMGVGAAAATVVIVAGKYAVIPGAKWAYKKVSGYFKKDPAKKKKAA